jgi:ankyrin repeat protein
MCGSVIIEAASNPNVCILEAALHQALPERHGTLANQDIDATAQGPNAFYDALNDGYYTSALIEATKARLLGNVELLLAKGADPNGLPIECMDDYSMAVNGRRQLQRKRHPCSIHTPLRSLLTRKADLSQSGIPTQEELEKRREMFAPFQFWAQNIYCPSRQNEAQTALEGAAEASEFNVLERLMDRRPDISFWTAPKQLAVLETPTHSSLSTANPLIIAIQKGHTHVIRRLLSAGFNPNIYQSSTPRSCVTPLMVTAMLRDWDFGVRCFDVIVQHSKHPIDLTIRTPIFGTNILHMAAASLSLPMLKAITNHSQSLTSKTSLGHSALHIAYLPLDDSVINWKSLAIATSVKDVRTLDRDWIPQHPPASYSPLGLDDHVELDLEPNSSLSLPQPIENFKDQCEVIRFLLCCQGQTADSRDLYQNTPLHYLVSYRQVNMDALELLLETQEGKEAWMEAENEWGSTPHDLFEKGLAAKDA